MNIILIYKITKKCNRRPILQTPNVIALQSQRAMTNQNENTAGTNNSNETQSRSIPGENHIVDEEANHDRPPSYMEVMAQSYSTSMNS